MGDSCDNHVSRLIGSEYASVQVRFRVFRPSLSGGESGRPPLLVLVNPTGAGQPRVGTDQAMAAVYVIDPGSARLVNENHLRELFGLTPAEAAIAALLTQGCTAEEAAERTGVTMNTIRTHLKRTLEKTGCRRQAETRGARIANFSLTGLAELPAISSIGVHGNSGSFSRLLRRALKHGRDSAGHHEVGICGISKKSGFGSHAASGSPVHCAAGPGDAAGPVLYAVHA